MRLDAELILTHAAGSSVLSSLLCRERTTAGKNLVYKNM